MVFWGYPRASFPLWWAMLPNEVAEKRKSLLGCVGPGREENQRSKMANSLARAAVEGSFSGRKVFIT